MIGALEELLRHLVTSGPARNPAELERLIVLIEHIVSDLRHRQGAEPAPATAEGETQ